jgi:hypothetical protein
VISSLYLNSSSQQPRLRIGVLVSGSNLIAPLAAVLGHIVTSSFCSIEVVAVCPAPDTGPVPATSLSGRIGRFFFDKEYRSQTLYAAYSVWDAKRSASLINTFSRISWRDVLPNVPTLNIPVSKTDSTYQCASAGVSAMDKYNLDVILDFTNHALGGDILHCARHGIWSFHYGDSRLFRGGPSFMWEVMRGSPLSAVSLRSLNHRTAEDLILTETQAPTQLGFSRIANQVGPYSAAVPLVIWKLHQLHQEGWPEVKKLATESPALRDLQPEYGTPTNMEMLRFLLREAGRATLRSLTTRYKDRRWQVALRKVSSTMPWENAWSDYRWIKAPKGHIFADPFLFEHHGRTWLFVEDFEFKRGKGVISCCELFDDGRLGKWQMVLDHSYHLSFPFVFESGDTVYMLPETAAAGFVDLYRAVDFPLKWERDFTLWETPARDTVLHVEPDGTHYFFSTLKESDHAQGQLFLFTTEDLKSPWRVHPASPLSLDARYARNGGSLARINDRLYRISQDSVPTYGSRLHFHEVTSLSKTTYTETLVGTCEPDWANGFRGMHSYCRSSKWEVIDALKLTPRGNQ